MPNRGDLRRGRHSWLSLAAALGVLSGCEFLPGTDAYDIERAKRTATTSLIDPSTAQFRDVQKHGDWVCGELNAKNRMGAFVGFKRFVVRLDNDQAQLDPEFRFTDLLEAEDSCRSVTFSTYSSTSSTLSACNRASEQRTNQALQSTFDADWSNHCSPVRAKSPFRPTLNDTIAEPPVSEGTLASDQPAAGTTASTPATQTDDEASDEGPAGTDTQAPGGPDQTELDRIFNGPPPKIKVTQPSGHSNDPLEPAPD